MTVVRTLVICAGAVSLLAAGMPTHGAETAAPPEETATQEKARQPEKRQHRAKKSEKTAPQAAVSQQSGLNPQQVAPIFEERGILTPRRTLVMEPSFQYVNSSSNRVALSGYTVIPSLNVGLIDVRNVNSNTYVTSLAARYGITSRLEFEVRVPYVYRSDSTSFQPANASQPAPGDVFNAEGNGVGDIEFGPRYQLNQPESSEGPYFILGVRAKSDTGRSPFDVPLSAVTSAGGAELPSELPTGSGFWALQPTLTAMVTSDPAVFFGTLSYMWNIERNGYDPGDTVGFNVGVGFGLNENVSMSVGYDHVVLGKTKRNGVELPGSIITQVGTLLLGCSYKVNDSSSIGFSLGAGLTAAASNVQLTVRVPISFLLGGS